MSTAINMASAFGYKPTNNITQNMLLNIGAGLDIPTGSFQKGIQGETICNGGLNKVTAVIGPGNSFKSTIIHYMSLAAANSVISAGLPSMINTYDSEMNADIHRYESLASKFTHIPTDIFASGFWNITDKSLKPADGWFIEMEEISKNKIANKAICTYAPFVDPYTKKPGITSGIPTFMEVDSMSEIEPESAMAMLEEGADGSESNTYYMKQGLYKNKIMSKLPIIANTGSTFVLMTAHIGGNIDMATGPAKYQQPTRKLQHMKMGDSIKGVSGKFNYLVNTVWFADTASKFINQGTKGQEYPTKYATSAPEDLNIVKLKLIRSKTGLSGIIIEIICSQAEGLLKDLTYFHNIKENNRFGISGSLTNYHLDLYPDVNLSRTTVRDKLHEDKLLARACEMTCDMMQAFMLQPMVVNDEALACTPAELYEDIKKLGYDWNVLLRTRNYWTIDQYTNKVPFLSIIDLLRMRKGLYHPYFLDDKKQLKKEFQNDGK